MAPILCKSHWAQRTILPPKECRPPWQQSHAPKKLVSSDAYLTSMCHWHSTIERQRKNLRPNSSVGKENRLGAHSQHSLSIHFLWEHSPFRFSAISFSHNLMGIFGRQIFKPTADQWCPCCALSFRLLLFLSAGATLKRIMICQHQRFQLKYLPQSLPSTKNIINQSQSLSPSESLNGLTLHC